MPIYLPAPAHDRRGPDGQGWNRLSLNAGPVHAGQCALRPRSYATLRESWDTRRAQWGGFGPCGRAGYGREVPDCRTCPVLAGERRELHSFEPDVLVRVLIRDGQTIGEPHVMNRPGNGWESTSQVWTWQELARLEGWRLGRRHVDEHGEGFWLHAEWPPSGGVYGRAGDRVPAGQPGGPR
jgi:hypothetical protein